MNHFLSFIIPCYNREKTIREAIDSIYQQVFGIPFEVIVVDDCSTDGSRQILQLYQGKHSNFHFHLHTKNWGPSEARNTCVKHSKGDLIFNLDSDNALGSSAVDDLIKLLDERKCEGASFAEARIFRRLNEKYVSRGSILYDRLSEGNICDMAQFMRTSATPASQGNYLYTRKSFDLAKGYSKGEDERVLETYRFGFRQLASGARIVVLPSSFYWHRWSRDSKWRCNHRLGINDRAIVNELRRYSHLFTDETNQLLRGDEIINERKFFKLLNKEKLKLK